jgi:pimeloyl-ACP methyl ester carboxylesterase
VTPGGLVVHCREAGAGPGVVCLHCNAGSGGQWGRLVERLAPRYRVFAPDLWSSGRSPKWPGARLRRLDDEVDLVEPVLRRAGPGSVLVGHSYGAAVALRAAQRMPYQVRALALYEPTLFSLLDQESPAPNEADGIRLAAAGAAQEVARGRPDDAARHFIDYWSGAGAWDRLPAARREPIVRSIPDVAHWAHALFHDSATAAHFKAMRIPVLVMRGTASPASARGVARILTGALPDVRSRLFPGLGHMGPVEEPGTVNTAIERFLAELETHPNRSTTS